MKTAEWWIDNMQSEKGYFYYRQYPLMKAKTPMLHWSQAVTYKGSAYHAIGEVLCPTHTYVGWTTHGHTGGDVPLHAFGPGKPGRQGYHHKNKSYETG